MSVRLAPYSEYKDSSAPWLGKIPKHWDVKRLKFVSRLIMGQSPSSDDCNTDGIGFPFLQGCAEFRECHPRPAQYCTVPQKTCPPGAILLSVRAPVGRLNVADQTYGIGRGLCAVVPDNRALHQDFAAYGLQALMGGLLIAATGSTYDAVSVGDVGGLLVPIPHIDEQLAIIRFLAHADRRINRLIRAKRRLIELLNEQKQAIIHRAVICGPDPNVRLKPSGIDWLGDVPEHWEVRPAKYSFREIDERSVSGEEELLSVSHITGVSPRSQKNITMFMASSYVGHKLCRAGDLVINTMWAWMAALGISKQTGIVSPSYAVYRPIRPKAVFSEFVDYLLRTKPYVAEYVCRSTGIRSSRLRLYPDEFLQIPLVLPPCEEQEQLVTIIARETLQTDNAINRARREIDLLCEYRTRLTADAVTGKLDVRGVNLPAVEESDMLEAMYAGGDAGVDAAVAEEEATDAAE